jgi:hypothetical protein
MQTLPNATPSEKTLLLIDEYGTGDQIDYSNESYRIKLYETG